MSCEKIHILLLWQAVQENAGLKISGAILRNVKGILPKDFQA